MKQLVCEMCGSNELIKQDGVFVCQNCHAKYSVEEAKKMMVETDDSSKTEKCGEPQNKEENIESPQLENTKEQKIETKSENIFADVKTEKKNIESFLTKPFEPEGCGCLPAFVTTPIFIFIFFILFFLIIGLYAEKTPEQKKASTKNEQLINAQVTLARLIKANLREPKSYENIAIDVYNDNEYIWVKNTFRGKNLFGGYEVCTYVARFKITPTWEITEWEITNNPSSNSGCRAIMIALP